MQKDKIFLKTRFAIFSYALLNEPFIAFFGLLPFILRKDLFATIFQISIFTMLKPAVSIFSFYWGAYVAKRPDKLRINLISAGLFARVPFLLFPFFQNSWYLIFSSAIYILFTKAAIPAWMEILKLNLGKEERQKNFSLSLSLAYLESIFLALLTGSALDFYFLKWQFFFALTAILGLFSVAVQFFIPLRKQERIAPNRPSLFKPWKDGWTLIKSRPDFARFLIGTTINGIGLMLIMPVIPLFFADTLCLSHTELSIARYIFMGLGFVFFSPIWGRSLSRFPLHINASIVCLGFAFFPLLLLFSKWHHLWIYISYLIYGITQAGSQVVWNMSGPIFAGQDDSSLFTAINLLGSGLRGMIVPLLSGLLTISFGIYPVFVLGMIFCFIGSLYMLKEKAWQEKAL